MTAAAQIETTFREEHGRVLAALISQLGDFTLAEDALQDALVNALERWGMSVIIMLSAACAFVLAAIVILLVPQLRKMP